MNPSWIDPDTRGWQSDSFESIPIEGWLPIYTTPPQRPWVGLTIEDCYEFAKAHLSWDELLIAAETKLEEKNI
jgi:hypothetical protein